MSTDNKYNIQTLHKYLTLQLIKEKNLDIYNDNHLNQAKAKATEIINKNSTNLWGKKGLAWDLGRKNFKFFCLYFLQDTFVPKSDNKQRNLAPVHYEMWNDLDSMILEDEFDKFLMVLPRGTAKTTVCDFAVSVYCHCYGISIYSLVAGRSESDAEQFIKDIRKAFEENEYIIKAFGELIQTNNRKYKVTSLEIELINSTKIEAVSSQTSLRGRKFNGQRPTLVIADDYQSKADVITPEARDKKYNTFMEDVDYVGDEAVYRDGKKVKSATKFIVLGTILHKDCFISRIMKLPSYKKMVRKGILIDDIDTYFNSGLWLEFKNIYFNNNLSSPKEEAFEFYYQHEEEMKYPTLWDDKIHCVEYACKYFENPSAFKQEVMNDASKIGEKVFTSSKVEEPDVIESHNFEKTMLCCDPAGTRNKNKNRKDYYAFCVGSLSDNGFKYVRKGELYRFEFEDYINHVLYLLKKYPDITHVWIEKNTYSGADVIKLEELISNDPELSYRDIEFINTHQNKNKDDKISTIIGDVNNGRIIFNSEDKEFIQQIMDFQGCNYSVHDDSPDICSEFSSRIDEIEVIPDAIIFDRNILFSR